MGSRADSFGCGAGRWLDRVVRRFLADGSSCQERGRAMPAPVAVYQEVAERIERITRPVGLRRTAVARLALLVTGILAARSAVVARMAAALFAVGLTEAGAPEG